MSEPRRISPLLDGYSMGSPISEHFGVRSYPAMPDGSDDKYILKIISIPASQVKLEALLLTGAFPNEEAAGDYFKDLAEDVVRENTLLDRLAKMEGFLPFCGCQTAPMENAVGQEVYLLSPYRPTLERHLKHNTMTHLAAINLGLDLCASLTVCRQLGYIYTNLKPGNVFICNDHEFRIGDLGFLKLGSLRYLSMPERYISAYTAPEIVDAYSDLNTTLDTYAAGLILYQVYNGGELPFQERAGSDPLPPPAYADYELSEIILKACAPDPKDRWENPYSMGQALVAYMQRNGVNDTPIVAPPEERPQESFEPYQEMSQEEKDLAQVFLEKEFFPDEVDTSIPDISDLAEDSEAEPESEQIVLDEFYALIGTAAAEDAEPAPETHDADTAEVEDALQEAAEAAEADSEEDLLTLSFFEQLVSDDTAPSEEMAGGVDYSDISSDAFDILAQVDDLIAHETPEGVVAPEPVEIPMPAPIVAGPEASEEIPEEAFVEPTAVSVAVEAPEEPEEIQEEPQEPEEEEEEYDEAYYLAAANRRASARKWIAWIVVLLLLVGMAYGSWIFYKDYYIRNVNSLTLTGNEDQLVVSVLSDADDALLSVVCTDTYGNTQTAQVLSGKATFKDLNPNTLYTVKVQITGMHKLIGDIQGSYTTPVETSIVSFSAVTGNEPGSAILSFTVDGMDAETWVVTYSTPGEEEQKAIFSGHMVNITGLSSHKTYSFRLSAGSELYVTGKDELIYVAQDPVFAQNLAITAATADSLTVSWDAPEDSGVTGWTVRCYSDNGYDKTVKTTDTTLVFEGIQGNQAHTVEVLADGMSAGNRCYMTAGAITVSNIRWEPVNSTSMKLSWDYAGDAPKGAWIISYCGDNADFQEMARSETNSVTLSPMIPGATYQVSILLEDGTTIFTEPVVLEVPKALNLNMNMLARENITTSMVRTPLDKEDWEEPDLEEEDYTDTYKVGEKASFLLLANRTYNANANVVNIMYVIHDMDGKLISCNIEQNIWRDMWYRRSCELDIPALPEIPGDYQITLYFNGATVHTQSFHIQ